MQEKGLKTDLFTFWPPGPLDLAYETSPVESGMPAREKLASHWRAAVMEGSSEARGWEEARWVE